MRQVGSFLLVLGLLVGGVTSLGFLLGFSSLGLPWLVTVGLVKLAFLAAGGLMAGGAVMHRLARRTEERARLEGPPAA
jgi:hypothetical protein